MNIALAETLTSIPFYQQAKEGAIAAGVGQNANVTVQGPAQSTGTAEATIAQNLENSQNPDGFGVNPCVLPAWTQVDNQIARSVPDGNVVAFNCKPIETPTGASPIKTFVGADDRQTGIAAIKTSVEAAHLSPSTTGTVLLAKCAAVPTIVSRVQGAQAEAEKLLPKAKVVVFASNLAQSADTTAWTSAVEKYPHVVLAYGACDQDLASMFELKTRGVGGDFATAGADLDVQELQGIKEGKCTAAVAAAPWIQGYVTTRLLIAGARGKKPPAGWVDTGLYPITKTNVGGWINAIGGSSSDLTKFRTPLADKVLSNLSSSTHPIAAAFKCPASAPWGAGRSVHAAPSLR